MRRRPVKRLGTTLSIVCLSQSEMGSCGQLTYPPEAIVSGELIVYSKDRVAGSASSTDFIVRLPTVPRASSFTLAAAFLPVSLYNITAVNNALDFDDGAVKQIQVSAGTYSIASLVAAIKSELNDVSTNFDVTFDSTTMLVTVSRSAGTFELLFATGAGVATSIAQAIGFPATDSGVGASFTGSNSAFLYRPTTALVQIQETGYTGATSAGQRYTFSVPLIANVGTVEWYEPYYAPTVRFDRQSFQQFTVKLFDEYSRPLSLLGGEWSIRLLFT